jgi:DNA-binding NtrC family response regulator
MLERILVVDDEPLVLDVLADVLAREGFDVSQADGGERALEILTVEPHALLLCDIRMPGMDGLEILREVRRSHPATDVVMMTGFGSLEGAIDAMALGAADYLIKPLKPKEVVARIRSILLRRQLENEVHALHCELRARYDLQNLVAISPRMSAVLAALHRIKASDDPVALHGEPGSGRGFVARALHYVSPRRSGRFVALSCALPPPRGIHESLFGAAASGKRRKLGLVESLADGTLYLGDVDRLDLAAQAAVGRAIANHSAGPTAGASRVRWVCSTSEPAAELAQRGALAPELAVLASAITVSVPPLRQRTEDLPGLVAAFLEEYAAEHGRTLGVAPGTVEQLAAEPFPGNVRQLFAVLAHAAKISVDSTLTPELIARSLRQAKLEPERGIAEHLGDREYEIVLRAVQRNPGRLDQAARELGVSRTTLWRRMRKYDIRLSHEDAASAAATHHG